MQPLFRKNGQRVTAARRAVIIQRPGTGKFRINYSSGYFFAVAGFVSLLAVGSKVRPWLPEYPKSFLSRLITYSSAGWCSCERRSFQFFVRLPAILISDAPMRSCPSRPGLFFSSENRTLILTEDAQIWIFFLGLKNSEDRGR